MGTEPNGYGMLSMVPMPSTAMVPAPSCVNASIGNNATHFHGTIHGNGVGAVPSRVNGP